MGKRIWVGLFLFLSQGHLDYIILSRSIHFPEISIFLYSWIRFHCDVCYIFIMHSFIDGHLGWFHFICVHMCTSVDIRVPWCTVLRGQLSGEDFHPPPYWGKVSLCFFWYTSYYRIAGWWTGPQAPGWFSCPGLPYLLRSARSTDIPHLTCFVLLFLAWFLGIEFRLPGFCG